MPIQGKKKSILNANDDRRSMEANQDKLPDEVDLATAEYEAIDIEAREASRPSKHRSILAMDALLYTGMPGENRYEQLKSENLLRELNKAHCGFAGVKPKNGACVIETGFWGCGAFGGDPEIKAIIQLPELNLMTS